MENDKPKRTRPEGSGRKKGDTSIITLTEVEYIKYIKEVIEMSLKGTSDWNIKKYLDEKGLSYKQSLNVRTRANEYVLKNYKNEINTSLERSISQWQEIYDLAMKNNDMRTAVKARENLDKISGLYVVKFQVKNADAIPDVIEITEVIKEEDETENN